MVKPQTKVRLLGYFDKRVGQVITLDDLQREFPDMTADQIRVGINNLRNSPPNESGGFDMRESLKTMARGNAWTWRPSQVVKTDLSPEKPSKRCFEEVGPKKDGTLVIQADDGTLWEASPL